MRYFFEKITFHKMLRFGDLVMRIGLLGVKEGKQTRRGTYQNRIILGKVDFSTKKSQFPPTNFFYMIQNIINDDFEAFPVGFASVGGSS